ncbi:MAG: type II toxin-antitoxin system VapC family toxin [Thermaerobacter sp.]|nr:type II toxin-antitoxin system VapC family toxin [Thermaerobacter sp.]
MSRTVLDASAVLALLQGEQNGAVVATMLDEAVISTVNMAEVVGKLQDLGMPDEAIREALSFLPIHVLAFSEEHAYEAGLLRATTRPLGLSLGDRCCLAVAKQEGLAAVTADRAWCDLSIGVSIETIR